MPICALELLGDAKDAAAATAKDIVALETKLAKEQMTRVQRRDPDLTYNKLDISGLKEQVGELAWDEYLAGAGHPEIVQITVDSPKYLKAAAGLLAKSSPETMQRYLRWRVLQSAAPHLPKAFVEENYAFFGKKLRGPCWCNVGRRWTKTVRS